jgi:hypothetical protein
MTPTEDIDGPVNVGLAVGGAAVQLPLFTVIPLAAMLEAWANATTL